MQARAEHVWVTDIGDPAPGLLLGWRQTKAGGWEGWCVVARPVNDDTEVRQGWVAAAAIRRVG